MRYQSPSDLAANSVSHKHQPDIGQAGGGGEERAIGTSPGPAIFTVPGLLTQDCPLRVGDPDVRETSTGYTLIFKLPPDVKGDGLDVSVSGRLLTVEARVTRGGGSCGGEAEGGGAPGRGGGGDWETPFTRTHSAARSFVIPVGVSNEVTASWVSDGRVEIKLNKLPSHSAATADSGVDTTAAAAGVGAAAVAGAASSTSPTAAMEDWGGVAVEGKDEPSVSSSTAEGYLSSLTGSSPGGGTVGAEASPSSDPSAEPLASAAASTATAAWPSRRHRDRSMLAALDDEFRDLAKSMWEDAVRFPTEEQVAATVAKARHERAKRVRVMRRAMMATDVSENELSYVVR